MLVGAGIIDYAAPAWAVVIRRSDGKEVGRIPLGRDARDGEQEFRGVTSSLALPVDVFLRRWDLPQG